jgi:hypothetical protein
MAELDLPRDAQKCVREYVFLHVFFPHYPDDELKRLRRTFRTTRKIQRWGAEHCTRMELMISGYLALRELGLANYIAPRGRKRKKR